MPKWSRKTVCQWTEFIRKSKYFPTGKFEIAIDKIKKTKHNITFWMKQKNRDQRS